MTTFAKLRDPQDGLPGLECVYNRDLERDADPELLYIVLSEEVHDKFGIDYDDGEMLIYSPKFEQDLSCAWVAQTIDFDFIDY